MSGISLAGWRYPLALLAVMGGVFGVTWLLLRPGKGPVANLLSGLTPVEPPEAPATTVTLRPPPGSAPGLPAGEGLRADFYRLPAGPHGEMPDLSRLAPVLTRIDRALDFPDDASFGLPFRPDEFAARWTGTLVVPADGGYVFTLGCDDGAVLRIDGTVAVDAGPTGSYRQREGGRHLAPGPHEFELLFREVGGGAACRLWWRGPGFDRRPFAGAALRPPEPLRDAPPFALLALDRDEAVPGEEVGLRIAGDPGAGGEEFRVEFAGGAIVAARPAGPGRWHVRVPEEARSGPVLLRHGALASRAIPLRVLRAEGLLGEYFRAEKPLAAMPDLSGRAPLLRRFEGPVDFPRDEEWDLPFPPDDFAARFTGLLRVPETGEVALRLGSDDGSTLRLEGRTLLDLPGLHAYEEREATLRLEAGDHPLEILYFEARAAAALRLLWKPPGAAAFTPVPASALRSPSSCDGPRPAISAIEPDAAAPGAEIAILGSGFGTDPAALRVVFPGEIPVAPPAAEEGRLRVRVPAGCGDGPVRVEAGLRRSNGVPFRRVGATGLRADYWWIADPAEFRSCSQDQSPLRAKVPSATRLEGPPFYPDAASFGVPLPAGRYVARWRGTLSAEESRPIRWTVRSDDGAMISIDGTVVLDDRKFGAVHEASVVRPLAAGEHRFEAWFFQAGGDARMEILWSPDEATPPRPVPRGWFTPTD